MYKYKQKLLGDDSVHEQLLQSFIYITEKEGFAHILQSFMFLPVMIESVYLLWY
jgi:hypothetical protein